MPLHFRPVSLAVEAIDDNAAPRRHENAHQHADRRRFAGPVRSKKSEHFPILDRKR